MIRIHYDPSLIREVFLHEMILLYEPLVHGDVIIETTKFFNGIRMSCDVLTVTVPLRENDYSKTAKYTLYCLLSELTGISLPWGSLLGVRPLRMFQNYIENGMSTEEAEAYMKRTFSVSDAKIELLKATNETQQSYLTSDANACLYVHVPICVSKCSYCSFPSAVSEEGSTLCEEYLNALLNDYEKLSEHLQQNKITIDSVYFGGGTPSVFSADQMRRLFQALSETMKNANEITFEAGRTDTISEEKLHIMKQCGITRISLNPQTTNDATLQSINRKTDYASFREIYELARRIGFDVINCDLIFGLEGETEEDFEKSLTDVIELDPENITLHTLCAKRTAETVQEQITEKQADVSAFHDKARLILKDRGYEPYYLYKQKYAVSGAENVGYTKKGAACLYNIRMMGSGYSIYAIGATASTKICKNGTDQYRNIYQVKDLKLYIGDNERVVNRKMDEIRETEKSL